MNVKERIERAIGEAQKAGYQVTEVWLGPVSYGELMPEIRKDEKDFEWYSDLRIRKALEDNVVRAGATACEWGAGIT